MTCLSTHCPWTSAQWRDVAMCADAADCVYEDSAFLVTTSLFNHIDTIDCAQSPTKVWGWYDRAVLFSRGKDLVLAFRGTVNDPYRLSEWKTNLNVLYGRSTGHAHRGFHLAVDRLWDRICLALKGADGLRGDMRLFITGHSKGAGMAYVAAARLAREGTPNVQLITFSEPPVYNPFLWATRKAPAERVFALHRRLIYSVDFLPALTMFMPDHSELVVFTSKNPQTKHQHRRQSLLQYLCTSFIEGWRHTNPFPLVTQHGIGAYRQLVYQAAGLTNFVPLPRH